MAALELPVGCLGLTHAPLRGGVVVTRPVRSAGTGKHKGHKVEHTGKKGGGVDAGAHVHHKGKKK